MLRRLVKAQDLLRQVSLSQVPHLFPEGFQGCAPAEAFAGRAVQAVANLLHGIFAQHCHRRVTGQPATGALIQVLDRSLLPRRLRVAEPCGGSDPGLELAPVAELDAAVEGDLLSRRLGQGLHHRHQSAHEVGRAPVVVAEQHGEAGLAFNQ